MTEPTGKPTGRPRKLTPEQEAEVYDAARVLGRKAMRVLTVKYNVSRGTIYRAVSRERKRRAA